MSEHTNSREQATTETRAVPEDGHPTAAETHLDQLLAAADDELSESLDDTLDLASGLRQLACLPAYPGLPRRPDGPDVLGTDPSRRSASQIIACPNAGTRTDINSQLQQALDLLQHSIEQVHGLLTMTDDGPPSLETARSKLTHAQLSIMRVIAEARARTLTRTRNTAAFNDIHDCVNVAWTTIAQALESPSADRQAVFLDDALDTLDRTTQGLTQAQHILDHLLDQIGEDLGQPLPA